MTVDRAFERLVSANPVPDVERYVAETFDLESALDGYDVVVTRRTPEVGVSRPSARLLVAAAAFVAVLVVAVGIAVLGMLDGGRDATIDEPVDVVTSFFDRWNEGDVDHALDLVSPGVLVNGGLQSLDDLRGLMLYAAEFDAAMSVACVPAEIPDQVSCSWTWTAESAVALGLEGVEARRFVVDGGLITGLATPNYGVHEQAISDFARAHDPEGFAAACDPQEAPVVSAYGFPFDARCGAFLAGLEQDFIAALDS